MNKLLLAVGVAAIIGLVACNGDKSKTADTKPIEEAMQANNVVYYGCPMKEHDKVAGKEPGTCNECGMALVPVVVGTDGNHDFYGCPMAEHSHIRSDEPGTCAECGMTYKPLKFDM